MTHIKLYSGYFVIGTYTLNKKIFKMMSMTTIDINPGGKSYPSNLVQKPQNANMASYLHRISLLCL